MAGQNHTYYGLCKGNQIFSITCIASAVMHTGYTATQITWNTDWLNKDVSINMYGRNIGKGMKNLLIRHNDSSSWYDWQSKDFSGSKDQVVSDSIRTINDDGTINEAAMRTEIKLSLKDSLMRTMIILKIAWDTYRLNNDVR